MSLKNLALVTTIFLFVLSCGSPKIHLSSMKVESRVDNNYQYNKKNKIKIINSDKPSEIEIKYLPLFKRKLEEHGFNVVDKYSEADRLLVFTYKGNMILEFYSTTTTYTNKTMKHSKPIKAGEKKGLTFIHLKLYELFDSKPGKLIWDANVSGDNKKINADPSEAFDLLILQYGKNKTI